jgi:tRNA1(Val) A37 N6-methylase TrmN6
MQIDAELSDDAVLGGRLRLLQPQRGHRFGHDAILLAAAVAARSGERAIELGAGVGAAGLALAARVKGLSVALVEIDPMLAGLAAENAKRNGLGDRVTAHCLDVSAPDTAFAAAGLVPASFDHVVINPPFNDPARHNASPDPDRDAAHMGRSLAGWLATARGLLRHQGLLTLIFRADALAHVLACVDADFGAIAIAPIYPQPNRAAIRVIVSAIKDARGPLALRPGLLLNDNGHPTAAAEAILRHGAALGLWEVG